jgi:hypothetical protein
MRLELAIEEFPDLSPSKIPWVDEVRIKRKVTPVKGTDIEALCLLAIDGEVEHGKVDEIY